MASSSTPSPDHYLIASLYGNYCESCQTTVKERGNCLFTPDDNTIRNHFLKNNCFEGDTAPNASDVERELARSQKAIHLAVKQNPELARGKIALLFPNGCQTQKAHVCLNCGFSAKKKQNFDKHFGPRNDYGCLYSSHSSGGKVDVCIGKCNITCPKSLLQQAENGELIFPKRRRLNNSDHNKTASPTIASPTATIPIAPPIQRQQQQQQQQQHQQQQQQFMSCEAQMSAAQADTSYNDDVVYDDARIKEALSPFVDTTSTNRGDRRNIHFVERHRSLVVKVIDHEFPKQNPDQFWHQLASMSSTMQQDGDPPILKVIADAGKEWFTSGAANNDVHRITAGHRAQLFQVGEPKAPDAETLVRGKTFVISPHPEKIVTEWDHLIHFIVRRKPSLIEQQLKEAQVIYNYHISQNERERDAKTIASQKIVNTNIIVGIVLAAVLEPPSTPNGINTMQYFLVSRAIESSGDGGLKFKHGGGIC